MPSQNEGMASVNSTKVLARPSMARNFVPAASSPIDAPISTSKASPESARASVYGKRSRMVGSTCCSVLYERPRSPWTAWPRKRPYCTVNGWSRPS